MDSIPSTRYRFDVTLAQDVVISESAATAGDHRTLHYLPGSLFLGLTAARLYARLSPAHAWQVFHSGAVSFGDGLPRSTTGAPAWPTPLSLHHYKSADIEGDRGCTPHPVLRSDALFDPSHADYEPDSSRQPEQLRGDHVTEAGERVKIARKQRLKTAIDPQTGRIKESQLFGYEAIRAGHVFSFELAVADSVPGDVRDALVTALQGPARLGRSRSAEFGGVDISLADTLLPQPPRLATPDTELTLWLVSDMALYNELGEPTLIPAPEHLGLPPSTEWNRQRSFLRTRSYSPYNGKRRGRDPERQIITRGSVLRYTLPEPPDPVLLDRLAAGVGRYQEAGLGRVLANPELLAGCAPGFRDPAAGGDAMPTAEPTQPETPLIRTLLRRRHGEKLREEAQRAADAIFNELRDALRRARAWTGTPVHIPLEDAPKRAQWGRLKQLANDHRQAPDKLWQALTNDTNGMLRERSGWQLALGPDESLGQVLQAALASHCRSDSATADGADLAETVGRLAARAMTPEWERFTLGRTTPQRRESEA